MSTSRAHPVLRTPDLRATHDAARRLLALATGVGHCDADGRTTARTVAEARRPYETFPDARATAHHAPPGFTEVRALFDAGDRRFDALLSRWSSRWNGPPGRSRSGSSPSSAAAPARCPGATSSGPPYRSWAWRPAPRTPTCRSR
ncbi:hypothetical protein ABZX88_25240 [Kitasatospora aureofaciens]|uniref:hypothetical protein n=1 Tax=Kitasatospora aureofaciens TaxID=1894 RepID=UPI00339E3CBF